LKAGTGTGSAPADAVVVGSGAAGGWAAKVLSESGLDVLVLESGPEAAPDSGGGIGLFPMIGRLLHYAAGKRRMQSFHPAYWGLNPNHFIDDRTEPFTTPPDRPFNWIRSRQLGGRTLLWGGVMLRMSDHELKAGSRQGFGLDWPLSYTDLAPWYDRVERSLGVFGTAESLPQLPDGLYVGSRPLTAGEEKLREGVEAAWPGRRVIPSRGMDGTLPPSPGQTWSRLTSVGSTLADALKTGRTRIKTNAIVSHLLPAGQSGGAGGVGLRGPGHPRAARSPYGARGALRVHDLNPAGAAANGRPVPALAAERPSCPRPLPHGPRVHERDLFHRRGAVSAPAASNRAARIPHSAVRQSGLPAGRFPRRLRSRCWAPREGGSATTSPPRLSRAVAHRGEAGTELEEPASRLLRPRGGRREDGHGSRLVRG
jgi:choline dehydrogenase-like flavoprotein